MEWMILPYKKYADFEGRSQRKEYWMFSLFFTLAYFGLATITVSGMLIANGGSLEKDMTGGMGAVAAIGIGLMSLVMLGSIVPSIAVQIRRWHDINKSGWFVLLNLIPYVGWFIALIFMCFDGTKGPNRFGDDPKGRAADGVFE